MTGPTSFGTGGEFNPDLGFGSVVGIDNSIIAPQQLLYVPYLYISGDPLSKTWGTGQNQDFFRIVIGSPVSVPEPGSILLLATAFGLLLISTGRLWQASTQ
jgi:hypothetical protein